MDRLQILKKSPFFSSLSEPSLKEISRFFSEEKYPRDDYIFFEGDVPEWLHIVMEGRVKLLKHSDTGKDIILQIYSPGDMFGEVSLFDRKPYAASAQAMEPSILLKLPRKDFFLFFGRHPFVATEDRVEQRIAQILLKLADKVGISEKGGIMINLPLTRQDLADMAGTTVETAIRVMSRFTKSKIIRPADGKIFLLHPQALQGILEGREDSE
jgi:CRP-like cAMP-binding protein